MSSKKFWRRHTGADENPKEMLWIVVVAAMALVAFLYLVRPTPFV
jgi:hypothetical protein